MGRNSIIILALVSALALVAWLGYVQLFTKGLEALPSRLCDGVVERSMIIQVMPPARAAEEKVTRQKSISDTFYCHVVTSDDSLLWGEAHVRTIPKADWLRGGGNGQLLRAAADGIEARARNDVDEAAVYVPCTLPPNPSYSTTADNAVIARVSLSGDARATGTALRQALTDIAYELAKHVYKLSNCEDRRNFPKQLPRYQST